MNVISLLSRKGGSGKSTLTIHFAVEAKGQTAIIDMDPQGSTISWFKRRELSFPILIKSTPGELAQHLQVCEDSGIDNVFIDTMPDINRSALVAASLSNIIVIPTKPSILDLESIVHTVNLVHGIQKKPIIILNQVPSGSTISSEARELLKSLEVSVCPIDIKTRLVYSRALINGQTAGETGADAKASSEITDAYNWIKEQIL